MFKKIVISLLGLFITEMVAAQDFPEPMRPARLVNDFAGVMSAAQQNTLEAKLQAFERTSSTQIAVISVTDLHGYAISDYAARLFDRWGIGAAGNDNGVLILVKPKTSDSKGEVFISIGYGLEGVVPDILAGRIVDREMIPSLREGDYYGAIDKASNTIISLTKGEFTAKEYMNKSQGSGYGSIVFIVVMIILLVFASRNRRRGGGSGSSGSTGGGIPPIVFLPWLLGRRGGGGFGGGSGGGGFGGFGGGRTGGGGAGGSW